MLTVTMFVVKNSFIYLLKYYLTLNIYNAFTINNGYRLVKKLKSYYNYNNYRNRQLLLENCSFNHTLLVKKKEITTTHSSYFDNVVNLYRKIKHYFIYYLENHFVPLNQISNKFSK